MIQLEEFEGQLKQAVFDINEEWRQMGVADLKDRLRKVAGIHTLKVQPGAIVINNQTIPIAATATDDDIAAAIQNNINKINTITAKPTMSITGLQSGAFKALLADMKKEIADAQTQGIADVKSAKDDATTTIKSTISGVKSKIKSEVDDALQEFAEFTNGGPA